MYCHVSRFFNWLRAAHFIKTRLVNEHGVIRMVDSVGAVMHCLVMMFSSILGKATP